MWMTVWTALGAIAAAVAAGVSVWVLVGRKRRGKLRISAMRVDQDPLPRDPRSATPAKAVLNFWVTNDGESQVILTDLAFLVIDTARCELIKGGLKPSETYDLDLTDAREPGQTIHCPISQEVEPGKSDRFAVRLAATGLGPGVFAAWKLRPTLKSNYGSIEGETVEVWLPARG